MSAPPKLTLEHLAQRAHHGDVITLTPNQVQELSETQELERRRARGEAWRWRMVARVAERIALVNDTASLEATLAAELARELPVQTVECVADDETWVTDRFAGAERARAVRVGVARDAVWVTPVVGLQLDDHERGVLDALAPHVAHAIARVRLESTRAHLALARERLSHFILHDLKNPLSIIDVNLRALRDEDTLDEEMRGAVSDALAASAQTKGMLQDLLDVGLAEEGRLPFRPTMMDAEGLVESVTEPFRSVIEARGARLAISCANDARVALSVDAGLVMRVLQNLVTNASRFVPNGGTVKVELGLSSDRARVVIAIENDGPSIPDTIRTSLFEKYGQVNAAQATHNRGLGLYFCRLVADRHGGDIRVVDPASGSGARFEIALPIAPESARSGESARLEECAVIPSTSTPPQAQRRSGRWRCPTQSLASIDASPTPRVVAAPGPAESASGWRPAPLRVNR